MQTTLSNEYRYWKTMRSIAFALLIFFGLFNLVGLLLSGVNIVLSIVKVDAVTADVGYQLLYGAGYLAAFMLPVAFLKRMIRKAGISYLPMRVEPRVTPWLPLILFAGISMVLATAYLNSFLVNAFSFAGFSQFLPESSADRAWYTVVLELLVLCLVPAVCEEFLFRGAILTNLLPFGRANAILVSALLFGLMHQNFFQFFYAFCAGIILGLIYERTGNIWSCILLHFTNNFFSTFETEVVNAFGELFSPIAILILEIFVFALGIISAVVLIFRFAPRKQEFREGIFGKPVPADDAYSAYPISAKQRIKGFFNVPMVIFLILAIVEAAFVLLVLPLVQ